MARLSWALIFSAAGVLAFASPAQAQTTAYAAGAGYPSPYNTPNSVPLTIQVSASVGGRCGFATGNAPGGNLIAPNIDTTGFDQSVNFILDCTGAFRVGVLSTNGGLLTSGPVPTGYGIKAPYDVQLNLQSDLGAVTATSACQAAELKDANTATSCTAQFLPGGANFSGTANTTRGLRVNGAATSLATNQTLRVKANAYAGPDILTAGTYTDILTVTVSVAP